MRWLRCYRSWNSDLVVWQDCTFSYCTGCVIPRPCLLRQRRGVHATKGSSFWRSLDEEEQMSIDQQQCGDCTNQGGQTFIACGWPAGTCTRSSRCSHGGKMWESVMGSYIAAGGGREGSHSQHGCQMAIAPTPSTLAQSKERKGSNFAVWQPCPQSFCGSPPPLRVRAFSPSPCRNV